MTEITEFFDDDVPAEVKKFLIQQDIQMWKNTRYQMQLGYRVNKGIDASDVEMKSIEDELLRCEKALDVLTDELRCLQADAVPAVNGVIHDSRKLGGK